MVKLRKSYPSTEVEDKKVAAFKANGHGAVEEEKVDRKRRRSDKIVYTARPQEKSVLIDTNGTAEEEETVAPSKNRKRKKSEKTVDVVELEDNSVSVVENGHGTAEEEEVEVDISSKKRKRKQSIKTKTVDVDQTEQHESKVTETVGKTETQEEKLARRKIERKQRRYDKKKRSGKLLPLSNAVKKRFNSIWDRENKFVSEALQVLPEVRRPHLFDDEEDKIEEYLLEEESAQVTEKKRAKFLAKMRAIQLQGGAEQPTRALTHEELKERLHAKITSLSQTRNERKHERRLKKAVMKKEEDEREGTTSDKKKKFISKANPNLKNQQKGQQHNLPLKDEKNIDEASGATPSKTPLRKKPVVKSNGEVVYSKFDFISADSSNPASKMNGGMGGKKTKPKAEDLLKTVQKTESKIARLETEGRRSEAVSLVETQKWDSALKRAQGEKIRDDPSLLKKTIKKQEKRKQVNKKKWVERTEHVEKLKKVKQDKRQANIQARKDDRVKKVKKQQKKRGRAA